MSNLAEVLSVKKFSVLCRYLKNANSLCKTVIFIWTKSDSSHLLCTLVNMYAGPWYQSVTYWWLRPLFPVLSCHNFLLLQQTSRACTAHPSSGCRKCLDTHHLWGVVKSPSSKPLLLLGSLQARMELTHPQLFQVFYFAQRCQEMSFRHSTGV